MKIASFIHGFRNSANTLKSPEDSNLTGLGKPKTNTPKQLNLLSIEKEAEIDGVGMGVLSDGTPYLTGRGLARLCGINPGRMSDMQRNWDSPRFGSMTYRIQEILETKGVHLNSPLLDVEALNGNFYAYSDSVCLAVLEYYAFDAPTPTQEARKNYRLLAGKALRDFIFAQVGYDPEATVSAKWRQFHDRMALTHDAAPKGFFGVFKELSQMVLTLGQAGLLMDEHFVPDISVGSCWASYWEEQAFDRTYGARERYSHNYPDYFPQSQSNPQLAWCYPESALGAFRKWLDEEYVGGGKFKKYIVGSTKKRGLPVSFAQLALSAYGVEDKKPPKKLT